jgi:hypothetical protein
MDIVAQINDFTIRQFTDQSSHCVKSSSISFVCDAHGLEIRTEDLRKCDLFCLFELWNCAEGSHFVIAPHVNAIHPSGTAARPRTRSPAKMGGCLKRPSAHTPATVVFSPKSIALTSSGSPVLIGPITRSLALRLPAPPTRNPSFTGFSRGTLRFQFFSGCSSWSFRLWIFRYSWSCPL